MLSRAQILRSMEFTAQYGESEGCFSPDWHANNPHLGEGSALSERRIEDGEKTIRVDIRRVLTPSGDVRLVNAAAEGFALPEDCTFVD